MVVGGENDPATPIRWAEEMAASLGAPLVRYTGEGHGFALDSLCVADVALSLFADGTLPEDDTVCDPDPDLAEPEWWSDVPGPASGETVVDRALLDGLLGFRPGRFWVEYRTTALPVEDAYARFVERMATADFFPDDPSAVEASEAPQFFEDANGNFVGLLTVSHEELVSYGFTDTVPSGHTLMVLYWYPLGD